MSACSRPAGERVSLAQLTNVSTDDGAEEIYREGGQRYIAIKYSVRGRDLGSTVEEAIGKVNNNVTLPAGYHLEWAGEYRQPAARQQAHGALSFPSPCSPSSSSFTPCSAPLKWAMLILVSVVMASIGGPLALFITHTNFSVSSAVGFLALFGVSVETGVIMIEFINQLRARRKGMEASTREHIVEAAVDGAVLRLRPVMMTMLVATLGLSARRALTRHRLRLAAPLRHRHRRRAAREPASSASSCCPRSMSGWRAKTTSCPPSKSARSFKTL